MVYFIVSIFGSVVTLFWLAVTGVILYVIWIFVRSSVPLLQNIGPEDISPLSVLLTLFLILIVNLLFSKIWFDLGRLAGASYPIWDYSSDIYLRVLIYRSVFVGITSVGAFLLLSMGKGTRYGIITLPYFIISLIFLVWLLFELCRFLLVEYESLGIYIVLVLIIVIVSGLILLVQKQYEQYKKQERNIKEKLVAEQEQNSKKNDSFPQV